MESEEAGPAVHKAFSFHLLTLRLKDKILIPKQKKCYQHKYILSVPMKCQQFAAVGLHLPLLP